MRSTSRRSFLRTGALGAAAGLAVACTSPTPRPSGSATQPPKAAATANATSAATGAVPGDATTSPTAVPASAANASGAKPTGVATGAAETVSQASASGPRALVVLQLSGGHDGLNAVIPYGDGLYYQMRPQINIPADKVLHLDDKVGLHPNLSAFKTLFDQGRLAVLQGVGYPNPNRSHFRSMEIWHSARPEGPAPEQGWLGAFMSEIY
jgi:hypothetical protein